MMTTTLFTLCIKILAQQKDLELSRLLPRLPTHPHVQKLVLAFADAGRLSRTALSALATSPHAETLTHLRIRRCTPAGKTPSDTDLTAALQRFPSLSSLELIGTPGLMRPTIANPRLLHLTLVESNIPTERSVGEAVQHGRSKAAATNSALNPVVDCPDLVSVRLVLRSPRVLLRLMAKLAEASLHLRVLNVAGNFDMRFGALEMHFPCLEDAIFDDTLLDTAALESFVHGCPALQRLSVRNCIRLTTPPDLSFFPRSLAIDAAGTPIEGLL